MLTWINTESKSQDTWFLMRFSSRNCKFGWDEENCSVEGSAIPLDFSETHVILILIILILIMLGNYSHPHNLHLRHAR